MIYSYLALGDSYTIGEQVLPQENFPNQLCSQLRQHGMEVASPDIIASTGWTADELAKAIRSAELRPPYDLVTLLIGVNNQYRGLSVEQYIPDFDWLIREAIRFAGNRSSHVMVLSIPDWSVTPFAAGRNRPQVAAGIDAYNAANRDIARKHNTGYLNITPWTREAANDVSLLAGDGLHPSGKEYQRWAAGIMEKITGWGARDDQRS